MHLEGQEEDLFLRVALSSNEGVEEAYWPGVLGSHELVEGLETLVLGHAGKPEHVR